MKRVNQWREYMVILEWALTRHTPPTREDILTRFEVSRATAYRWAPRLQRLHAQYQLTRRTTE